VSLAVAVVLAGLLLQAGVNLINDHADLDRRQHEDEVRRRIVRNARLGVAAIAVACLIGLWLVSQRGWPLLALGLVGVVGLWGYASDPINLKARGLGLPAVFLLTGMLMVAGAFYAVAGSMSAPVLLWSLPFSAFAALLLLANELRDVESDRVDGHRTFTVRAGYDAAVRLYRGLALAIGLLTVLLAVAFGPLYLAIAVLPLGLLPLGLLREASEGRRPLAQRTGRVYALYSACFLGLFWMSLL
jgi:1,4-dihydroxy-2-naphthoate octaprenyltransferase